MKALWKLLLIGLVALSAISCSDDDDNATAPEEPNDQIAQDEAYVTQELDETLTTSNEIFASGAGERTSGMASFCGNFDLDTENRVLTLDYGNGCTGPSGRTRSGRIIIDYTGSWEERNLARTVTYEDYSVEGNTIDGSFTTTEVGFENASFTFTRVANNISVDFNSGESFTYNGTHTYSWRNAFDQDFNNDEYTMIGSASGVSRGGDAYSSNIATELLIKTSCIAEGIYYPVSGVQEFTTIGSPDFTIDYGDGTCDKTVTVSTGRIEYPVELP